jgi:hypothetical protein
MSSANVRSIDALRDMKMALQTFAEEARVALDGVEMEIRQLRNWLERDQLSYWRSQVKKGQEQVAMAKSELFRKQLSASDAVSDTEQKEALRHAKRKLAEAEDKVERIKKWSPVLEHAIAEYHSQSQPLGDRLSGNLVNSLALLERMITTLDSYVDLAPPSTPVAPSTTGGSTTETTSAGSSASMAMPGQEAGPARSPATEAAVAGTPDASIVPAEAGAVSASDPVRPEEQHP